MADQAGGGWAVIAGQRGIAAGELLNVTTLYVDPDRLRRLLALKPAWVRLPLRIGTRPTGWDAPLLTAYAQLAGILRDAGIQVIALVYDGTVPGAVQADWDNPDPLKHDVFVARLAALVNPIRQALYWVTHWEIWNEPNNYVVWGPHGPVSGGTGISPGNYLRLLRACTDRLKAGNPAIQVITGGVVSHNIHGQLNVANSGVTYLDELYRLHKGPPPADGIGVHFYVDQPGHLAPEHLQRYLSYYAGLSQRWEGLGAIREIYVTEFGWATPAGGVVTPQIQAYNLTTGYGVLGNNAQVKAACWFSAEDSIESNLYFGLFTEAGVAKPAAAAFTAVP